MSQLFYGQMKSSSRGIEHQLWHF